jgi:hypothetical protein
LAGTRRFGEFYHQSAPPHHQQEAAVPHKPKFTRIPKVQDLAYAGVPTEAIPTYCALTDYANNKSGLCWPKMETLAKTLGGSALICTRSFILCAPPDMGVVRCGGVLYIRELNAP